MLDVENVLQLKLLVWAQNTTVLLRFGDVELVDTHGKSAGGKSERLTLV